MTECGWLDSYHVRILATSQIVINNSLSHRILDNKHLNVKLRVWLYSFCSIRTHATALNSSFARVADCPIVIRPRDVDPRNKGWLIAVDFRDHPFSHSITVSPTGEALGQIGPRFRRHWFIPLLLVVVTSPKQT
jgi:hypothetical protein